MASLQPLAGGSYLLGVSAVLAVAGPFSCRGATAVSATVHSTSPSPGYPRRLAWLTRPFRATPRLGFRAAFPRWVNAVDGSDYRIEDMLEARTSAASVPPRPADRPKVPRLGILRYIRSLQECKEHPRHPGSHERHQQVELKLFAERGRTGGARAFRHVSSRPSSRAVLKKAGRNSLSAGQVPASSRSGQ